MLMLGNFFRKLTDVRMRNKSFIARVNKKQNLEMDIPASCGGRGKYMKYVSFPWPPLEASLSAFKFSFLLTQFLGRN
jgi:hypothetical protein